MISDKKVLEHAQAIVDYCRERSLRDDNQRGCQNCILHEYGSSHWDCQMYAFDLREVLGNIEAKKKKHGYID